MPRPNPWFLFASILFVHTCGDPGQAKAAPGVAACEGKELGATCTITRPFKPEGGALEMRNEPGTCQSDQCCELDYSGGVPPKSTCAPCVVCKPDPADVNTPSTPGQPSNAAANAPADAPSRSEPQRRDPVAPGSGGPPTATPNSQRGCNVGSPPSFVTALVLAVLVSLGRRRGRR